MFAISCLYTDNDNKNILCNPTISEVIVECHHLGTVVEIVW